MLRTTKSISGNRLNCVDGEIGRCKDFLFDDRNWVVRYIVADTGSWIPKRKVLISPLAVREIDWQQQLVHVDLTKQQMEQAPPLEHDAPVSMRYELALSSYYRQPFYWAGSGLWGAAPSPAMLKQRSEGLSTPESNWAPAGNEHLRSIKEVTGYNTHARDGELGNVEEFIMSDDQWVVRYLALNTRRWLPGKTVLVPTHWVERVDWADRAAYMRTTKEQLREFPQYDPTELVNQRYEKRLYDFYGRPALS